MHGNQRTPSLMTDDLSKSASTLQVPGYEVLGGEPLHDITNVIQCYSKHHYGFTCKHAYKTPSFSLSMKTYTYVHIKHIL